MGIVPHMFLSVFSSFGWFVGNGRCGIHSSLFVGLKDMKPETKVGFRAYVLLCVGLSKLVLGFSFSWLIYIIPIG